MGLEKRKIAEIKPDPKNPRIIRDEKFQALVKSLKEFPEMLKARPIVCNTEMVALGGNMRLKAAKAAGMKTVYVHVVDWTPDKQREFRYKDNDNAGKWDEDKLAEIGANLDEWIPGEFDYLISAKPVKIDYKFLDDEGAGLDAKIQNKKQGSRYGFMVVFTDTGLYEATAKLATKARQSGIDISMMLLNAVKTIHDESL